MGLIRWNPTRPDNATLSVGGIVYACPFEPLIEKLRAFGGRLITLHALADLVKFPPPKVIEADRYNLLGVAPSEYVQQI